MKNREELLKRFDEAVKAREHGQTDVSGKMFIDLIKEVEGFRQSEDKSDLEIYMQIMSEYIIQLRHEGKRSYMKAFKFAQDLYSFSKSKKITNSRVVRGVSNTLLNLEAYEVAFDYLKELVNLTPKEDSARLGDAMAHLARCEFRMGKIEEAEKTLGDALKKIETNSGKSSSIEIAVWKSHALVVKAIILNSKGDIKAALLEAQTALEVAQKENVVLRINETTEVISYLKSKTK